MVKITRLLLVFALALSFLSAADSRFAQYDTKFKTASKTQKIEIYNGLRNIYVQSIINDDEELKKEVLTRLVESSKIIGMDYSLYQKELSSISKTNQTSSKNTSNLKKASSKGKNAKEKTSVSNLKLQVKKFSSTEDSFTIVFNRPLAKDELKYFDLDSKESFRRVYNIKAVLPTPIPKFNNGFADVTRVSQFSPEIVRVVFSNKKKKDIKYEIDGDNLVFSPSNLKSNDKTSSTKSKNNYVSPKTKKITKKQEKSASSGTNKLSAKFRSTKIVVLDPGHGGHDVGAVGAKKLHEKNIVLNITKKTGTILKQRGYKVYYTRSSDRFIKLRERTAFANDKNADLFISIHANAAPNKEKAASTHGLETFFLSPSRSERSMRAANLENKADTDEMNYFTKVSYLNFLNREKIIASNKLAIDVQSAMLKSVRTSHRVSDGGVREAPFWVLVGAVMPAILVETGYITHPTEGPLLANEAYANRLAEGIADGIDDYFAKNK